MLAPPWMSIPPTGYGGVESVVGVLTEALVSRGHDVTLFCAPGSLSTARVRTLLRDVHPDEIGRSLYEADHVARAFDVIQRRAGESAFDVVHDHSGFTALAMAHHLDIPFVHTLHGAFDAGTAPFYAHHGHKAALVAISRAQRETAPNGAVPAAVIPNPVAVESWPLREDKDDYVLWVGRMTADKGPHRAIKAARMAGVRILLAGIVQPGQEAFFTREVQPLIDGHHVEFVGEVSGARKRSLFAGARGLLMPIRWPEPFGMVMVEALACGTPVIAFPEGSAREVVRDGVTGFLVDDEAEMGAAIRRLGAISSRRCREGVVKSYAADIVAAAYERLYRSVATRTVAAPG